MRLEKWFRLFNEDLSTQIRTVFELILCKNANCYFDKVKSISSNFQIR